jgi:hypothetical protein
MPSRGTPRPGISCGIVIGYLRYDHESRTHLSLDKDAPEPRPVQAADTGRIVSISAVGGLYHCYERRAA